MSCLKISIDNGEQHETKNSDQKIQILTSRALSLATSLLAVSSNTFRHHDQQKHHHLVHVQHHDHDGNKLNDQVRHNTCREH